jgi:hypothetical protein
VLDPVQIHGHEVIHVQPEFYAMMMFAKAAPPGSRMVRVASAATPGVSTWATRQSGGETHVVIVNKNTSGTAQMTLRVPQTSGPATLETLRAPHLSSTSDVTLDGQTFGTGTSTGVATGAPTDALITPLLGHYTVSVPAGSAAMLTFTPPPTTLLLTALSSASPLMQPW